MSEGWELKCGQMIHKTNLDQAVGLEIGEKQVKGLSLPVVMARFQGLNIK